MLPYFFPTITLTFMIIAIPLIHFPSCLHANDNEQYLNCNERFDCASAKDIGYPFWGSNRPDYCGYPGFELDCSSDAPHINITFIKYRVLQIDKESMTLKVARADYWNTTCPPTIVNTTINFSIFSYPSSLVTLVNLTLYYDCSPSSSLPNLPPQLDQMAIRLNCPINGSTGAINYYSSTIPDLAGACKYNVEVPVVVSAAAAINLTLTEEALIEAIDGGFMLEWNASNSNCDECQKSGGLCGFNTSTNAFACHCANGTFPFTCGLTATAPEPSRKLNRRLVVVIGIPTGVVGIVVLSLVIICNVKRGYLSSNSTAWWKRDANNYHFNAEEMIVNFGSMAPKRYPYSDVKKLTKSFKDKIGEGGFGVVYKGNLPDGRMVAVKVLSKSKDNGEEFINEVASISRTSHVNVVSLLGFCYERSKRALVFEFVPNGSLDRFIYDKRALDIANCHLENKTMFQIAVGIARGLEYLHSGCRTRILHFDIKPHNILLDENFCPKISDFGLAKLCKTRESVVSMMGIRGTIGYIAPEVFSRTFGGVSHKSDVYSYGMLVLEMIGGRKDIEGGISGTSEKYFPHGIYKKLEQDQTLSNSDVTGDEEDIVKKMIIVSLWCIQTNPSDRPSIGKVIEMLEGSTLQSLQFPPKPLLDSPPRPPLDHSSTTSLLSMES
ncbi:hypothetical protein I3760_03G055900 [Carya illinoinensis]|nr:hypothetical protein I3760_03G055900 [Carya illinoinensis]